MDRLNPLPRPQVNHYTASQELEELLATLAQRHGCTPAEILVKAATLFSVASDANVRGENVYVGRPDALTVVTL